jgi:hypothetical protein
MRGRKWAWKGLSWRAEDIDDVREMVGRRCAGCVRLLLDWASRLIDGCRSQVHVCIAVCAITV